MRLLLLLQLNSYERKLNKGAIYEQLHVTDKSGGAYFSFFGDVYHCTYFNLLLSKIWRTRQAEKFWSCYSFVFYLLCAYYLVILPLPEVSTVAQMTGPRYELHLFQSWHNFMNQTVLQLNNPSTYLPAMRQSVFLEPVFNIFLLFHLAYIVVIILNFHFGKLFW